MTNKLLKLRNFDAFALYNKSKEFLIKYLKSNKNIQIQNRDYYELAIENAKDILKYSTKMKLYKF